MDDVEGRWFSFNIQNTDFIILEKKSVPQHLTSIESLDTAVTLQSLLNDLQDAGEVASLFGNLWELRSDLHILYELKHQCLSIACICAAGIGWNNFKLCDINTLYYISIIHLRLY